MICAPTEQMRAALTAAGISCSPLSFPHGGPVLWRRPCLYPIEDRRLEFGGETQTLPMRLHRQTRDANRRHHISTASLNGTPHLNHTGAVQWTEPTALDRKAHEFSFECIEL